MERLGMFKVAQRIREEKARHIRKVRDKARGEWALAFHKYMQLMNRSMISD